MSVGLKPMPPIGARTGGTAIPIPNAPSRANPARLSVTAVTRSRFAEEKGAADN
jgi:hypothetical protein